MGKKQLLSKLVICAILLLFQVKLFAQRVNTDSTKGELKINLQGVRNEKGVILLSLFSTPEDFPTNAQRAVLKLRISVKQLQQPIIIKNMRPGTYALALLHDEDENGKMNTTFLGLPKEGYGFSNNVMGIAGPPSFEKASFMLPSKGTALTVKVKY